MTGRYSIPSALLVLSLAACSPTEPTPTTNAGSLQPPAAEAPVSEEGPIIVMLGDSLTAGYQLPPGNALPAALQRDFDAKGVKAKFVNAGVSGDTTADGLNRYDWSVAGSHADLLVIALGANDFLDNLPPESAKKNLAAILELARASNLPAVLLGVAIPDGANAASDRETAFAAIYPELAKEFSVPYYPDMLGAIAGKPALIQQDGVHPTAEGVEAMAAAITGFLAPVVEQLPPI
jgi:acyl-CoA thioesterase I